MQREDERRQERPKQDQSTSSGQPAGQMNPGDQAPAGTPGTGENLCPVCSGEGKVDGQECANCGGTGVVIEGISGA